jgi:hypothetical protein
MAKSTLTKTKRTTKRKNTMRSKHTRKQKLVKNRKQTRKSNLKGGEVLKVKRQNAIKRANQNKKKRIILKICDKGEDLLIDNLNNDEQISVHNETDRKKAEALLTNDNTFLIRKSNNPTDSLTLVKKDNQGKSHKIKICKINNKLYIIKKDGTKDEYDNLQDLIKGYGQTYAYKFVSPEHVPVTTGSNPVYAMPNSVETPPVVNRSTKPQTRTEQPIYVPVTTASQPSQLYNPVTKTVYGPNPVYATPNQVQLPNPNYNHLIPKKTRSPKNNLPALPDEPLVAAPLQPSHGP